MQSKKKKKLSIPDSIAGILKTAGNIGDSYKFKVFAVGGFVRDLLLGLDNMDIDIVVEGDGLIFARELAKKLDGSLIMHKCFGTATIESASSIIPDVAKKIKGKIKLDVATARKEYYKSPAFYPTVEFDTIKEDLKRRDFTINAIAVALNSKGFAGIVDFFGGMKDLEAGIIRVLHDESFVDDPTRIFRAARFEQRYDFKMHKHTEMLARQAIKVGMLDRLKKQRIEKEQALILKEKQASKIFARMEDLAGGKWYRV